MSNGWKFPFNISGKHGRVEASREKENIRESVRIILLTEPGERMLHPEFGTKLRQFLFENIDSRIEEMIKCEVANSLRMWEPRISHLDIVTDNMPDKQGVFKVIVSYGIAGENEEDTVEVLMGDK